MEWDPAAPPVIILAARAATTADLHADLFDPQRADELDSLSASDYTQVPISLCAAMMHAWYACMHGPRGVPRSLLLIIIIIIIIIIIPRLDPSPLSDPIIPCMHVYAGAHAPSPSEYSHARCVYHSGTLRG